MSKRPARYGCETCRDIAMSKGETWPLYEPKDLWMSPNPQSHSVRCNRHKRLNDIHYDDRLNL